MKILIIDSGSGGKVVERYLKSWNKDLDIIYDCDIENMPYGAKSREEILRLTKNIIDKHEGEYDILVPACNTMSAALIEGGRLNRRTVDIITPTIHELKRQNLRNLAIISTEYTHKSKLYLRALRIPSRSSKTLAKLIEDGISENELAIRNEIKRLLQPMVTRGIERVVLGCTHYELIDYIIRDIYPHLELLYPGKYQAKQVLRLVDLLEEEEKWRM